MLTKNLDVLRNFADATRYEWLETNGLGGWSSSTITGTNTRQYHGLLVAAVVPPTERMVLLSKLDETIVMGDERFDLGVNLYMENVTAPTGHQHLNSFSKDFFPQWEYEAAGIRLRKTLAMIHGENTVVVLYDVIEAPQPFSLELLPLMAARRYHSLTHAGPQMHWHVEFDNGIFHNQPDGKTDVFISAPGSSYRHTPRWFNNFQYSVEQERGLDYTEDLFNHGVFTVELKQGDSLGIIISTDNPDGKDAHKLFLKENTRRKLLISNQPDDELVRQLVLAADQFIVQRKIQLPQSAEISPGETSEEVGTSIIAGYHWFTDWGRDAMISLPGLCLSTGRFADAKKILESFARSVSHGMLPNRFRDNGEEPEYNNVDGTLWYFIAVYKYLLTTGDKEFVVNQALPVLKEIIDWHYRGTRYNIHVDDDGLLYAGEWGQQLTWMDARIGPWVVTPRMGKPVEIQALWYNALRIFGELLQLNDQPHDALQVNVSAEETKRSFIKKFWYSEGNYLYDNIDENGNPVAELRPNQLFAISLPFALLEGEKAKAILKIVEENLYTPVGLRSLSNADNRYVPVYSGNQWQRDSSYHEGTAWSWLLGTYVDAIMSEPEPDNYTDLGLDELSPREKALKVIADFKYHLAEGCIGTVSEIFDGDAPHHPRGCVAQAWGVAELLRVIKYYQLYNTRMTLVETRTELEEEETKIYF